MGGIHPSEQSKMRRSSFSCQALVRPIRIVALLLVLVLGACASETADDEGPIVIGMAIGLTDFMAAYDLPALNGAQIAVDEINEAGGVMGRSLEIVTADTKSDIDQGTVAGLEVIDQGAHAMIVSPDYNMGGGAARAAQDAGLVVFSSSAGSPLFGIEGIGPLAFTMGIAATHRRRGRGRVGFRRPGLQDGVSPARRHRRLQQGLLPGVRDPLGRAGRHHRRPGPVQQQRCVDRQPGDEDQRSSGGAGHHRPLFLPAGRRGRHQATP